MDEDDFHDWGEDCEFCCEICGEEDCVNIACIDK